MIHHVTFGYLISMMSSCLDMRGDPKCTLGVLRLLHALGAKSVTPETTI